MSAAFYLVINKKAEKQNILKTTLHLYDKPVGAEPNEKK